MHTKTFKKLLLIITVFISCSMQSNNAFSFSFFKSVSVSPVVSKPEEYLKASVFVNLSVKDFEIATGRKLNFFQKVYFKIIQKQVKRSLKKNPDLLITDYYDAKKVKFKFSLLWFIVGSFIGPFGVLLAYTSHEKKPIITRKDKLKSVWIGCILFIIWFGVLFIF